MWPSGRVDARSWDAALDVVQQSLIGMAVANDVNDEQDFVLTQVFKRCEELRAKTYLNIVPTNQELAKKCAISPRTVTKRVRAVRTFGAISARHPIVISIWEPPARAAVPVGFCLHATFDSHAFGL